MLATLGNLVLEETPEEKEKLKLERRKQRVKDCGKFAWWFDPHTGQKTGYIRYCDNFRECPICLERRAKQEYEWMKLKVYQNEIKIVMKIADSHDAATKMVRGTNKDQYVRYPQEDGTEIVFLDRSASKEGQRVNPAWIRSSTEKWKQWLLTPEGRNKSGTMHIPAATADDEPFTIIDGRQFTTDAPENVVSPIMDQIAEETDYMQPENAKQVEQFIDLRLMMATAEIRKLGFDVKIYNKKMKVIHSKINWSNSRLDNLMVNTKNLTSTIPKLTPE